MTDLHKFKNKEDLKLFCETIIISNKTARLNYFTDKQLMNILKNDEQLSYFCQRFELANETPKNYAKLEPYKKTIIVAMIKKQYVNK